MVAIKAGLRCQENNLSDICEKGKWIETIENYLNPKSI
jgi:hypothetical protein